MNNVLLGMMILSGIAASSAFAMSSIGDMSVASTQSSDIDVQKISEFMTKDRKAQEVYKMITIIALINGAIAAVPGQMLVGVWICRVLEAYMAFEIAKTVGFKIELKNFYKLII